MVVNLTLRCRCGHSAALTFVDWPEAQDMVLRARCSQCGARGRPALGIHNVEFTTAGETAAEHRDRRNGGR